MKNIKKRYLIVVLALLFILTACGSKKDKEETKKEVSTQETKMENDSATKPANKDKKEIITAKTKMQGNVNDEDKEWILKIVELMQEGKSKELLDVLGGSAKKQIGNDDTEIKKAINTFNTSGKVHNVNSIEKQPASDEGKEATFFSLKTTCEYKDLGIDLVRGEDNTLVTFQIYLTEGNENQAELQKTYAAEVQKSREILEYAKDKNKAKFLEMCKKVPEPAKKMEEFYEALSKMLSEIGNPKDQNLTISVKSLSDSEKAQIGDIDKLIAISTTIFYEKINNVQYIFYYDESGNLISLNFKANQ